MGVTAVAAAAICNAVRQAMTFVRTGVIDEITEYVTAHTPAKTSAPTEGENAEGTTDAG